MSLRAVVIDDEAPARAKLHRYLAQSDGMRWVGEAADGPSAVGLIHKARPDVVFLDISMPGMDGFAVLQALGEPLPAEVVFVTAHDDQAVRAFEVHAFDYLLKPVGPERFARAIQRLLDKVKPSLDMAGRIEGLLDGAPVPVRYLERLLLPSGEAAELVRVEHIDRVVANRNYLDVFVEGQPRRLRGTLDSMHGRLNPASFVRVNRSTIVRLDAIRQVQPWPDGEQRLLLVDGSRVTWTRRFLTNLPPGLSLS